MPTVEEVRKSTQLAKAIVFDDDSERRRKGYDRFVVILSSENGIRNAYTLELNIRKMRSKDQEEIDDIDAMLANDEALMAEAIIKFNERKDKLSDGIKDCRRTVLALRDQPESEIKVVLSVEDKAEYDRLITSIETRIVE